MTKLEELGRAIIRDLKRDVEAIRKDVKFLSHAVDSLIYKLQQKGVLE